MPNGAEPRVDDKRKTGPGIDQRKKIKGGNMACRRATALWKVEKNQVRGNKMNEHALKQDVRPV